MGTLAGTAAFLAVIVLSAGVPAGCAQVRRHGEQFTEKPAPAPTATSAPTYTVQMLIESAPDKAEWSRDVQVPRGYDAYQLTELVTKGDLKAIWYPAYRSHFVESLVGVANEGSKFWLVYLWDDSAGKWTPLPVGADWFSVKDGHTLAWAYTDTSKDPASGPTSRP